MMKLRFLWLINKLLKNVRADVRRHDGFAPSQPSASSSPYSSPLSGTSGHSREQDCYLKGRRGLRYVVIHRRSGPLLRCGHSRRFLPQCIHWGIQSLGSCCWGLQWEWVWRLCRRLCRLVGRCSWCWFLVRATRSWYSYR